MDSISISVIIPAYNAGDFLSTAVQSVLNQSHRNLELLIIDDASTDATGQLAQVFAAQDARVRYHRNPSNTGVARSRNLGVSLARFDWIAFL
ncbi:MAG: glycosyltransferase family 2 protein, partial [Oscillospiraceae bacterium]